MAKTHFSKHPAFLRLSAAAGFAREPRALLSAGQVQTFAAARPPVAYFPRLYFRLSDCGTVLPPQDAAISDPEKPRLFEVSPKWARCGRQSRARAMEGFFHGQLDSEMPAEMSHAPTPESLHSYSLSPGSPRADWPRCGHLLA